jgi:hypothetical protein
MTAGVGPVVSGTTQVPPIAQGFLRIGRAVISLIRRDRKPS